MKTTVRCLVSLFVAASLLAVGLPLPTAPVHAQTITVDGNPAEWDPAGWAMNPPSNINTGHLGRDSSNNGQYIWTDRSGDHRLDGDDPDSNYDLTEFRVTGDSNNLYFLIRLSDITDTSRPYIGIAVDTTLDSNGQNWFGDLADTQVSSSALWEREIVVNLNKTGYYDPGWTWTGAGSSYISADNDAIEISMPWSALGVTLPARLRFTVLIAQHDGSGGVRDVGYADALDALTWAGGTGGSTWPDEINTGDDRIDYYFDVWFASGGNPYSPLLITEVYYDPAGAEPDREWIQIVNVSGVSISLSGYKIGDEETKGGTGEAMKQFPGGSIADRDSVVIANRATAFNELGYGCPPDYELNDTDSTPDMTNYATWTNGTTLALSNTADEVLLLDERDTVIDVVVYEGGSYPGVNAHSGASEGNTLERSFSPTGPHDTNDCAADLQVVSGGGTPCNTPTLIILASFNATAFEGGVRVEWQTLSEFDTAGFNVYRSNAAYGQYVRINTALIQAQGGPTWGATYTFDDTDVVPDINYYYRLEDVDIHGQGTMHGAVWCLAGVTVERYDGPQPGRQVGNR